MSEEKKKTDSIGAEAWDFLKTLLICMVVVFALTNYVIRPVRVDGNSMYPTLHDNDLGFSNLAGLKMSGVDRFDIVIIWVPEKDEYLVKRVVGMPNEKISYKDGALYINGQEMDEPFFDETYRQQFGTKFMKDVPELTLDADEYYCVGDNRPDSLDSRFYGPFKKDQITSKGIFVFWPFSEFGVRTW